MAVRRTLLQIGDVTAAGNRPVSELTLINSSYADPQADCLIWNIQSQAWQSLTPGTNTNSNALGTDRWSFESRFRDAIRSEIATGNLYVIKYALDSTMAHTPSKPSWMPGVAGNAYASTITQITNAAAAANAAGDTIRIDGIVVSIQTDDWSLSAWRAYGDNLRSMLETLRTALAAIPYCALGSFQTGAGATPVVVVEPHYKYTGITDTNRGRLNVCRMQAQGLQSELDRVRVLRTHAESCTDNVSFSALSMVSMSEDIADALTGTAGIDDSIYAEARVALILSDSVCEGVSGSLVPGAGVISDLPDHLQGAISGAKIWRPNTGQFDTLQVGVNNITSLPNAPAGFGPEIVLASEMRGSGDIWLVKGSSAGSFGGIYLDSLTSLNLPHLDPTIACWPPAVRNQLWELTVRGWLTSAVDLLRRQSKRPSLSLVVISFGHSDLLSAAGSAEDVVNSVRSAILEIRRLAASLELSGTPRFVVCVPSADLAADAEKLAAVRDGLLILPETLDDVATVDLTDIPTVASGVMPTGAGQISLAQKIYSAFRQGETAQVQPMFMPTMTELRKALRLSRLGQDNDALSMIDNAVQFVKAGFFRNLGEEKIKSIQNIAYTNSPKTSADYLRVLAATTEVKWVRSQLMRSMPMMFMDGATTVQTWQEESAFREGSFLATREEVRRLDEEIRQNLAVLYSATFVGSTNISVDIVKPDETIAPGDTVLNVL